MLTIKIDTSNAAFEDNPHEIPQLLQKVAARLANGEVAGKLKDSNGNTVGSFRIEPES